MRFFINITIRLGMLIYYVTVIFARAATGNLKIFKTDSSFKKIVFANWHNTDAEVNTKRKSINFIFVQLYHTGYHLSWHELSDYIHNQNFCWSLDEHDRTFPLRQVFC